ncbi:MAG: hypothetical protein R3D59_05905 [Paracoccaceae bacterium]
MSIPLIFLGLLLGAIMSIYVPMIAQTARLLGSGPMANVPFFFIAFATSVVIALATGHRSPISAGSPACRPGRSRPGS